MSDFSFEHTNLTPEQVKAAVIAFAPDASAAILAGKVITIALDGGESLRCDFSKDSSTLTVRGLGVSAEKLPYAALELGSVFLMAYQVPGTLTSHVAVCDTESRLATVYETWLCGEGVPAREVCREVYQGYITGREVPKHRPSLTKRLVGKAIRWNGELGSSLAIYATWMASSFVPNDSDQTFTAPTDYFEFDYHTYLYSRCEVEFSGELVLEVFDLHSMKLIGVRLGITKNDDFELCAYTAAGKLLGQFAAYGPFGPEYDLPPRFPRRPSGDNAAPFPAPKGARIAYRPFQMVHKMTLEEVHKLAARTGAWKGAFAGTGKEKRCMPASDIMLDHKKFTVNFDGNVFNYIITGKFETRFKLTLGDDWKTERYEAFEADEGLAFFTHAFDSQRPTEVFQYAIDFKTGLVTCLISRLNNERYPREPTQEWLFGYIYSDDEGFLAPTERHGFTDELVGRSFTWTYTDEMYSQHIYSTSESYSWSILMNGIPGMMWSSPCKYVKIRDDVYMMSWVEHRSAGTQGTYLFNIKTMHDCGTCFGITHDQIFEYNTFGAEARGAGSIQWDFSKVTS
jgi:hypothetical protein